MRIVWILGHLFELTLAGKLPVDYCYLTQAESAKAQTSQE